MNAREFLDQCGALSVMNPTVRKHVVERAEKIFDDLMKAGKSFKSTDDLIQIIANNNALRAENVELKRKIRDLEKRVKPEVSNETAVVDPLGGDDLTGDDGRDPGLDRD